MLHRKHQHRASQETSTNCHINVFSKCPISNKISIPETKTFVQLLDESVPVNKASRKRKSVHHAAIVTSSPYRALFEDSKAKKKCNTKTSTSLRNTQKLKNQFIINVILLNKNMLLYYVYIMFIFCVMLTSILCYYVMINIIFYVTKQVIRNLFLLYSNCK